MNSSPAGNYRPDVDGLRAIAILSVVFYHAGIGCPGGYVGVDVFFVISGFLISSLILKDLRENKFSLVAFWERRLRRIYPAAAVTVLVTLVAGWFLLLPEHLEKLGQSTIAQALLSANFYFWRTTNYFGGANEEKPLLHTWSLAVEEQFYLFFPLLLIFLFRRKTFRQPLTLISLMLGGAVASICVAVWGVKHQPYATFFLLPTRAWELLCGAMVAMFPMTAMPASRLVREISAWLGVFAIVLPVFLYRETTPFPGIAALPPCFGTALLIWANGRAGTNAGSPSAATLPAVVLSLRVVVFIGLISYSLYLWHWPVLAFSNYWKAAPFSLATRGSLVATAFILAVLSWRLVETPFRSRAVCGTRRGIFSFFVGASALAVLLGVLLAAANGFPSRISPSALKVIAMVQENREVWKQYSAVDKNIEDISQITSDSINRIGSATAAIPLSFLILGDSHAGCAIPIFDQLGKEYGVAGAAITYQGTPPMFGWKLHFPFAAPDSDQLWKAALDYAGRHKISHVFLVAYWSNYQRAIGPKELENSMQTTIRLFNSNGITVHVVLDNPTYDGDVVKSLIRKTLFPHFAPAVSICSEEEHRKKNSALYDLWSQSTDSLFLDPSPLLLDARSGTYIVTRDGVPLYFDHDHLTLRGEEIALRPLLQTVFAKGFPPAQLSRQASRQG